MAPEFKATLMLARSRPQVMTVAAWGMLGLLPVAALAGFVPQAQRYLHFIVVLYVSGYAVLLGRALRPLENTLELTADRRGLSAAGQPLVRRADIVQAFIRPASGPSEVQPSPSGPPVRLPARPLSVEVVTTEQIFNLRIADRDQGARLLVALELPVVEVAADYRCPMPRSSGRKLWVLVLGVNAALFLIGILASGLGARLWTMAQTIGAPKP